jgi:hypothetical protein
MMAKNAFDGRGVAKDGRIVDQRIWSRYDHDRSPIWNYIANLEYASTDVVLDLARYVLNDESVDLYEPADACRTNPMTRFRRGEWLDTISAKYEKSVREFLIYNDRAWKGKPLVIQNCPNILSALPDQTKIEARLLNKSNNLYDCLISRHIVLGPALWTKDRTPYTLDRWFWIEEIGERTEYAEPNPYSSFQWNKKHHSGDGDTLEMDIDAAFDSMDEYDRQLETQQDTQQTRSQTARALSVQKMIKWANNNATYAIEADMGRFLIENLTKKDLCKCAKIIIKRFSVFGIRGCDNEKIALQHVVDVSDTIHPDICDYLLRLAIRHMWRLLFVRFGSSTTMFVHPSMEFVVTPRMFQHTGDPAIDPVFYVAKWAVSLDYIYTELGKLSV